MSGARFKPTKDQREIIARCKAAGCVVVNRRQRGTAVTVITPDGREVMMTTLRGPNAVANFIAHMRRLGVEI